MFRPVINDVTTTYPDVPQLASKAKYPSDFLAKQKEAYPDIEPLSCNKSVSECFADCVTVAKKQVHWVVTEQLNEKRIYAVATSALFQFKDDISIEVRQDTSGVFVHMRSRSRKGKSDLGANAKRIRSYFSDLKNFWQNN